MKKYAGVATAGVAALFLFITIMSAVDVINPNERGVAVTMGKISSEVIEPGVNFHAPFVTSIRKFRVEPKSYEVTFSVGQDGAITKDMQTVGTTVSIRWMYDTSRIMDIVSTYRDDRIIESAMRDNVKASVKETTGKYSIYDLVAEQNAITNEVAAAVLLRMESYPIQISQTTITNWDWSDDFDKQIKETANRTQQVKIAQQEAEIAAAQAQKQVKEAEAKKQAMELEAEANLLKAQKDAEALLAKAEGEAKARERAADATAYENQKIAQNAAIMREQWRHEEEMERLKHWNGKQVSDVMVMTPAGTLTNVSGN